MNIKTISAFRAFWTTILVSIAWTIVASVMWIFWEVLWTDLLHSNPHRSVVHAMAALPLMGIVVGVLMLVASYFAAVIASAAFAAILAAFLGRVPFLYYSMALPLASLCIYLQAKVIKPFHWYTELPEEVAAIDAAHGSILTTAKLTGLFLPVLIGSWWVLRKHEG